MSLTIEARLDQLGIELPEAAVPVANYVSYVRCGNQLFVSGQLPVASGELLHPGQVGSEVSVTQAQAAARQCVLNLIAQVKAACDGDLQKVRQVVKLGGFVNCAAGFTEHAQVINGASDLISELFAEKGKHARAAVGCSSLPLGAAVEIEGIFELADEAELA
ncbi:MAG: RidA family protein [Oceanospirillaceae bacterium]|nr:RidA family protein [Oceanospirillaceae bacterium]